MYGVLYLGTNKINGKQYVGQTIHVVDPSRRWNGHFYDALHGKQSALCNAIRKYGDVSFEFKTIGYAEDKETLDLLEDFWIVFLNTLVPFGYNQQGGGAHGKDSDETREKKRIGAILMHQRPEVKVKHRASLLEAAQRPGVIERRSEGIRRAFERPEVKEKHRNSIKAALNAPGMHEILSSAISIALSNPEVKNKLAVATAEAWNRPGAREQRTKAISEALSTPESKALRSALTKLAWSDPVIKAQRSEAIKRALADPEINARLRAAIAVSCADSEVRKHKSAAMQEVWQRDEHRVKIDEINARPETKQRRSEAMQEVVNRPGFRDNAREKTIARFADPAARQNHAEITNNLYADPDYRARHKAAHNTPEYLAWLRNSAPERTAASKAAVTGSTWINDGAANKRVKQGDPIPEGWTVGRIFHSDANSAGLARARHVRHHVNKGRIDPDCLLCQTVGAS